MKNYIQRDKKQKSKKNRMPKHGRSLLSTIEPLILKKGIQSSIELESIALNLSPNKLIKKGK